MRRKYIPRTAYLPVRAYVDPISRTMYVKRKGRYSRVGKLKDVL